MIPLFKHQEAAAQFITARGGSGAVYHEIGLGKTRTALEIFGRLRDKNPGIKMMVVCPISLIEGAWGEDIRKYSQFQYVNCHDQGIDYVKDIDIYIMNYEMLLSPKNLMAIRKMLIINFMCVLDESSKIKNHKDKTTKAILSLRGLFKHRIVMSGIPAPNVESEYWAQISFLQSGIFHDNFFPFRSYYFHLERERNGRKEFAMGQVASKDMYAKMFKMGWHYAMTDQRRRDLMARIAPLCHYAKKKDCLDLPEQVDEVRIVNLGEKQAKAYKDMKRDLVIEIKDKSIAATTALSKILKLRELVSGFIIDESKNIIDVGENPKIKELEDVLEEAGAQQVIIWCTFQHEIRQIKDMLGEKAVTLYGETDDRDNSITNFKDGKAQYLIAHGRSAGHGLTFVNCYLEVFYSLDYSWEMYEQCRGRIHRAGQVNKCTYIHLLGKDTIDNIILDVLRHKEHSNEIAYKFMAEQGNHAKSN